MRRFGQPTDTSIDLTNPKPKEAIGTEPQKILTMKSGLEIPADIYQRDLERKKAVTIETEILATTKPSILLQIGHFADKQPLQACLIALAAGAALGSYFYDFQH